MTVPSPDQYTLPEEPVAFPVKRPKALFDGVNGVIGLRAGTTRLTGGNRVSDVWLFGDPPSSLLDPSLWSLQPAPGAPRPGITGVTSVAATTDVDGTPIPSHLTLALDTVLPGRGAYRLRLDPAALFGLGVAIDPLRVFLALRLRPECGDVGDCLEVPRAPMKRTAPDYDTLARDYTALRAMLMERRQFEDPSADTSIADLHVTLVELFAYLGDLLHYRLDRVATEMWLGSARRRANVTRLARVVDYPVQPAISAATAVQVVVSRVPGTDPRADVLAGDVDTDARTGDTVAPSATCFTLESASTVYSSHDEIGLYDWTEDGAGLPVGATSAVLVRPPVSSGVALADWLPVGALLGFEVVAVDNLTRQHAWIAGTVETASDDWPRAPLASRPAQVMRVTSVVPFTDPLRPSIDLVRVFWDGSDALTAPVPCSVEVRSGTHVGVARLGLVAAHHGLVVDGPATLAPVDRLTGLPADPATEQLADYLMVAAGPEASPGLSHRPGGRPWQLDVSITLPNGSVVPASRVTSLLRAPAGGFSVVVDTDDELPACLRFRTGALGLAPPSGSVVSARYQVGAGPDGNAAANTTTRLVRSTTSHGVPCIWLDVVDENSTDVGARNISPGVGGMSATSLHDVRRDAPQAYTAVPRRAVLISDLPSFSVQVPSVLRATANRSWSGSWPVGVVAYESRVTDLGPTADPVAAADLDAEVQSTLDAVRMCGTEVVSLLATPVGILIALTVCLFPGSDPDTARAAILASLRPGTPEAPGLFARGAHPMGSSVYLSTVVATVAPLPQVDAVSVTEARRLSDPAGTLDVVLVMGPTEVAVCDDDSDFPDRGRIVLTIEGGR